MTACVKIHSRNVEPLRQDKWKKRKKKTPKIVDFLFEGKEWDIFTSRNALRIFRLQYIHDTYYTLDSTGWVYHTCIMTSLFFKPGIYGIKWQLNCKSET